MQARFFRERPALYGMHYAPESASAAPHAIVLCHPLGEEHIRSHSVFVGLAHGLTRAGFHVLRFDLRGCGDSEGALEEATLEGWLDDALAAVEHVKRESSATAVSFLGLKLGATIARRAAARIKSPGLILWDPILDGRAYLEGLRATHAAWLRGSFANKQADPPSRPSGLEVHGFVLSDVLQRQIEALAAADAEGGTVAARVLLVATADPLSTALAEDLRNGGAIATTHPIEKSDAWLKWDHQMDRVLRVAAIQRVIVGWAVRNLA